MNAIPYGKQSITEEDKEAVLKVLEGDLLTQGPAVEAFENVVAGFINAKYAVAVTNGTAALHLAAMALGVTNGDRVLVTPNTFVASANCIRYCGGDVEFVDIDSVNFCMDLNLLEQKLAIARPGTYKGIVCVDFAGYPVDFERLRKIADKYALWIIEDACHALGADFLNSDGEKVFSGNSRYADISVFSFHPVKHIATGEGGLITTSKVDLYDRLKMLRTHGIVRDPALLHKNDGGWYYEMQSLGYNYRISDILCALGVSQMSRLAENLSKRRRIAEIYNSELKDLDIGLPQVNQSLNHAYHLYVIQSPNRRKLYDYLRENKIYPQVHYIPVHMQPYYADLYGKISLPLVENYYERALSLPMYHSLSDTQLNYVIEVMRKFK